MTSVKYNTTLQMFLTQRLIYLIDNHHVTREEFNELFEVPSSKFSQYMKEFNQMLEDLKMDIILSKFKRKEDEDSLGNFKTNYSYVTYIEPYKFDYMDLNEEKLIKYSMTIVYLMLKNHQYVTTSLLEDIFPNFNKKTMANLKDKLSLVVADDIGKNEINSYIFLDDEDDF